PRQPGRVLARPDRAPDQRHPLARPDGGSEVRVVNAKSPPAAAGGLWRFVLSLRSIPVPELRAVELLGEVVVRDGEGRPEAEVELLAVHEPRTGAQRDVGLATGPRRLAGQRIGEQAVLERPAVRLTGGDELARPLLEPGVVHTQVVVEDRPLIV